MMSEWLPTAVGNGASAAATGASAIGASAEALGCSGIALGINSIVEVGASNSIALGADSFATVAERVSVGDIDLK